ncbi:succinylglutamate-semialdehyde dehydrogenase [Legionella nagasakiensis]|uniref:succinylglutamate-semialdehyde dehydrogenase n=1 Tax=Legionella nagasakiensis TaxID=535290 RepID=UPI0010559C9F|nr:succinylglutamate-semialdehyde dehydrogenase [Legionella nagasakiensis]
MDNDSKKNNSCHYYDGHWISGSGDAFMSINPAEGTCVWEGRNATTEEIAAAVAAAQHALKLWSRFDFATRTNYLQNFAKQVEMRRQELTYLIALETGKPLWEAETEVNAVIGKIGLSVQAYQERTYEKKINTPDAIGHLRYKPHGVVAVLGPFNFPAHLSNGHIVPALLAGNTVVYKPSELTPAVAELIIQCWHDSGLPPGVLNCIQGDASCAKTLLQKNIQGVYFTGSYKTGLAIHQQFSDRPGIILALEMGGNNPLVIDAVKDLQAALYHTLLSTLITAGQRCTCARRVIIPDTKFGDEFLECFIRLCKKIRVGTFKDVPEPFIGPVIRHSHALMHLKAQEQLRTQGGNSLLAMSLLADNTGLLSPGIIDMSGVENPSDEEIFAPLVQIYRYHNFEQALVLANQTQYGLAAGIMTDNDQHYEQFYQTVRAGIINWNRPTTGAASNMPFGGIGHSGNHRPSAYYAADYCAYPIASLEQPQLSTPPKLLPGIELY